uniref:Uncharacterized protein n=1 Tax=Oryza glumipatula TaxID=40148 RepID=A0A0E0BEK1_9ORYZ
MAARAGFRPWWDAFTTNVKNQGTLVIDKLKRVVHQDESESRDEEKLKELIRNIEEESRKRFERWCRAELAKECWREHLLGEASRSRPSPSMSTPTSLHRPPPPPITAAARSFLRSIASARLAAYGCEVLEKIKREQLVEFESVYGLHDYFDTTGTHDDASSSADHCVGPILPQLQSDRSARFAAWAHSSWALAAAAAAAAVDDDDEGKWMKPCIGPVLACDCEPEYFDSDPAPPTPPTIARPPRPLPPASPPPPSTATPPPSPASPPPPSTATPPSPSPTPTTTRASPPPPPIPTATVRPPPPLPRATVTPTPTTPPSTATTTPTPTWVWVGGVVLSAGVAALAIKLAYAYLGGGRND